VSYFPTCSRSKIQSWIDNGAVLVNGKSRPSSYKTKVNDVIQIAEIVEEESSSAIVPAQDIEFGVIFEDDDIMVIDKPAGITVHPGAGNYDRTLVNGLVYRCGDNLSSVNSTLRPGIVHRIDKDTSGVLVVAKNDFAHMQLAKQFEIHSIVRKYVCFVYGVLRPLRDRVENFVSRDPKNRLRMTVTQNVGKRAVTVYSTIESYGTFASKVECELFTGRTHQIRVHLSNRGHSLIGDRLYKVKNYSLPKEMEKDINMFPRQALHAKFLQFEHPVTGKTMIFESDMPDDMNRLEQILKDYKKEYSKGD